MAAEALEKSVLESKDKEQLTAIATALGIKASARLKKADIIDKILDTTGGHAVEPARNSEPADNEESSAPAPAKRAAKPSAGRTRVGTADVPEVVLGADGEPLAQWEIELLRAGDSNGDDTSDDNGARGDTSNTDVASDTGATNDERSQGARDGRPGQQQRPRQGGQGSQQGSGRQGSGQGQGQGQGQGSGQGDDRFDGDGESRSSRRRRRRRGKGPREDGPQGADRDVSDTPPVQSEQPVSTEPVLVAGYLDLRDEGYGFLRVNGYLPNKDDVYIPVKQTRQYGLRKGDHVTGLSRPAGRNEKNPALIELHTVNGADPDQLKNRKRFEDLTALFPDDRMHLEDPAGSGDMTARIIDLVSPIGKGQRGIIVSPPKAGKTTVMKTIATAIERNNPEVKLIVLLIDERPEEVTDMRRTVKGEVIASTFDRPSDQHTHVAEMALEKAKRMVEVGEDVVIILDGITRLSRAYNLAAPASGRILSGGIDAGALYPPKKFFGAARNVEEGGSLTILATALVETNSRMDEAIFEEFKGTGNMELRLDRRLAERRIYPAIDVDASSTRHEELLFDRKQLQQVWKLRRVLSGLAADGNAAPGLELLIDRLKTFRTNDEFLAEIAKQPSM
jgi:transcription termination factor Rho